MKNLYNIQTYAKTHHYTRIYYQNNPKCLSTCTLTIHALLHLVKNIQYCEPIWATWTFWMERYCGYLQAGLKSKVAPWANLNNHIIHKAYIEQVDIYYGLKDPFKMTMKTLTCDERIISDKCEQLLNHSLTTADLWE